MKKIKLLMLAVSVALLSSCEKKEMEPLTNVQNPTKEAYDYTERNSTAVAWDALPAALKDAPQFTPNTTGDNAKIAASYLHTLGPWGGNGGTPFYIYPSASTDKIYAIAIRSGIYVDAITVWYKRTNGTLYSYNKGGNGGNFYIQYFGEGEYISAMGGRSGAFIDRLTIYTNSKSFSYGGNGGNPFYAWAGGKQILGFFGRSGAYIDNIGGYVYTF